MLSNTATPYYYGQFRDAVIRGEIPVCHEIVMEMNRIDNLIRDPGVYYDEDAINGFIAFCESELTLVDGSDLELLPTFKLWAEQIFGWYYFVEISVWNPEIKKYEKLRKKKRLVNKQVLIIARSAAKSLYVSCLQAFFLVCDRSTTFQVTTAPTVRQADEVMAPIKTAIARARGPLFKMMTEGSLQNTTGSKAKRQKLSPTKKGIENFLTNSLLEVRPMRTDKVQGLRIKMGSVDEWLSCDIKDDILGPLEQGAMKIDDYLILAVSSEGTKRNAVGDDIKAECLSILRGEYPNPHVSIWYYKLDDIKEVAYPEMWLKAQPNLGKTVSWEDYQLEVEKMEHVPSQRNDILAKRFGIPTEGYTYFFPYEETIPHSKKEFWQLPCSMGADLSRGDDFCAFTFLFPLQNGSFGVKTKSYITTRTLDNLTITMRRKYDDFIKEGSLIIMEGSVLNMMEVYDNLIEFIEESQYDVIAFGYDPYNAKEFVERWCKENGEYGVVKVIQGARTESVPLGEIKILSEDRKLLFDEELMGFTMENCVVSEDTNGNRKLLKRRANEKIDNVAALMDAYVAYKINIDNF